MTPYEAAIYTRQRMNLPTSEIPRLITFIDTALEGLAKKTANSPKRRLLMTDRDTVTASITSTNERYYASITTPVSTYGVMKEWLEYGTVWHKYATSTFTDADVVAGSDWIAKTHVYTTGTAVQVGMNGDDIVSGLAESTTYYLINVGDAFAQFQFAASYADALAGTAIDIGVGMSGTVTVTPWEYTACQFSENPQFSQLTKPNSIEHIYLWLETDKLRVEGATSGSLYFRVPFVPTLDTLPSRLEDDFIDEMVKVATMQGVVAGA